MTFKCRKFQYQGIVQMKTNVFLMWSEGMLDEYQTTVLVLANTTGNWVALIYWLRGQFKNYVVQRRGIVI